MNTEHVAQEPRFSPDAFDVLGGCHRQIIFKLGMLAALISHLRSRGADAEASELAKSISHFLSTTARTHHEDEERHVFPKLVSTGDPFLVRDVRRLQQDHG